MREAGGLTTQPLGSANLSAAVCDSVCAAGACASSRIEANRMLMRALYSWRMRTPVTTFARRLAPLLIAALLAISLPIAAQQAPDAERRPVVVQGAMPVE